MTKLPRSIEEAVALLGFEEGNTVILIAPGNGYTEAVAAAVGSSKVTVVDPPPELEAPKNVSVVEELAKDAKADVVAVWAGMVPPGTVREESGRVADSGSLWAVVPRVSREEIPPVNEADLKRTLLVSGWRDTRTVALAKDAYAIRFHRRR